MGKRIYHFGVYQIIIVHGELTIGIGFCLFHFLQNDLVIFKISLGIEEKIKKSILKKKINMKQKESEENTEDRKEPENENKMLIFNNTW